MPRIEAVRVRLAMFAAITAIDPIKKPYTIQSVIPVHKKTYIRSEMSFTDLVLYVLTT